MITQSELKDILYYDANTGEFIWRIDRGARAKAGSVAGGLKEDGYLRIRINDRLYYAHRLAWVYVYGNYPDKQLDHINGVKDDNRICNLRHATNAENSQNLRKSRVDNKIGLLGVSFHKKSNKFVAQIRVGSRNKHVGLYDSAEQAHETYLKAKRELHEFCTI
jgi:hypothetical protein